jgi:hypothetical protein
MLSAADIEDRAQSIQKRVNDMIAEQGASWHPFEYLARAEMIAEEQVPAGWDWRVFELVGALPQFVLMQYDPRRSSQ